MKSRVITEEQLRDRLAEAGKSNQEIEDLIDQYAEASRQEYPDTEAIAVILQKTQEDSILRVRGFKLTKEQYDILLDYYEGEGKVLAEGQQVDANLLVQRALEEFLNLIS